MRMFYLTFGMRAIIIEPSELAWENLYRDNGMRSVFRLHLEYWLYFNIYKHDNDAKLNVYRTCSDVTRTWQEEK